MMVAFIIIGNNRSYTSFRISRVELNPDSVTCLLCELGETAPSLSLFSKSKMGMQLPPCHG